MIDTIITTTISFTTPTLRTPKNISMKKQVYKQVLLIIFINASDDLRISTFHETNGQAYLRKESPHWLWEFVYHNHCVSFVVYLPNKKINITYITLIKTTFLFKNCRRPICTYADVQHSRVVLLRNWGREGGVNELELQIIIVIWSSETFSE